MATTARDARRGEAHAGTQKKSRVRAARAVARVSALSGGGVCVLAVAPRAGELAPQARMRVSCPHPLFLRGACAKRGAKGCERCGAGVFGRAPSWGEFARPKGEGESRLKKGDATILVATDVIGRGIDIKNVKTIVNFDLPVKVTEYNNRIGRTARIGHEGRAISFYDPNVDAPIARRLCKSKSTKGWMHDGKILKDSLKD